jgi:hypothetical protein
MSQQLLGRFRFGGGYSSGRQPLGGEDDLMREGSRNVLAVGEEATAAFRGMTETGTGGRVTAAGSVLLYIALSLFYIGAGRVRFNDVDLGVTASTVLSFLLRSNGSYTDAASGPFQAGLAQPSAPGIRTRTPTAGLAGFSAAVSAQITRIRSTTGAESVRSPSSAVVLTNQESIVLQFPALDSNGQDRWGIYLPELGFSFGPYYLYKEIADSDLSTIDSIPRCYEISYLNSDLLDHLAPTDNYPPPAATHAVALEDSIVLLGSYGDINDGVTAAAPGNGVSPSIPGFPEAFSPDATMFLVEEPVVAFTRGSDYGFCWVFGTSSLSAITYIGGTQGSPVRVQVVWPETGIAAPHNACVADGQLYLFTEGGPARMGPDGKPERDWAMRVKRDVQDWPVAETICGSDDNNNMVVYGRGQTLLAYNTAYDRWGAPLYLGDYGVSGDVLSCVTHEGRLKITTTTGGEVGLYVFNEGEGGNYAVFTGERDGGSLAEKTIKTVRVASTVDAFGTPVLDDIQIEVYKNGDPTPARGFVLRALRAGFNLFRPKRINVKNARTFRLAYKARSTTGVSGPVQIEVGGVVRGNRK